LERRDHSESDCGSVRELVVEAGSA